MAASLLLPIPKRPPRLQALLKVLDKLYPTVHAESWDNVGLLLDTTKADFPPTMTVMLTNDLTEKVAAEAIQGDVDVVVSYHPTPFSKFNKVVRESVTSRILLALASRGVAVYSPHTACDVAPGGVNDWLISAFDCGDVKAAVPLKVGTEESVNPAGLGRVAQLTGRLSLAQAVERVKSHLQLERVRVAPAMDQNRDVRWEPRRAASIMEQIQVGSVAVCAGSGGSVLGGVKADMYLTGEMSHHDVLAANHAGVSVVLTDHSNTERGFLSVMREQIQEGMVKEDFPASVLDIRISQLDADPLLVV